LRVPSVLAITALAGAGLLGVGCGSSGSSTTNNSANASGYSESSNASAKSSAAGAAPTTSGASASASSGTAVGTGHTSLGTVLVAGPQHMTVYLFEADKGSTSSCSAACAQAWPPVTTTGAPQAEGAAKSADLGTTTRSDGTKQVTYKGHPLYYYVSDRASGETTGEGVKSFGAAWYVLNPHGEKIDNDDGGDGS
jgi:predicted lipoprotein with Yx(FWY)xxD motif